MTKQIINTGTSANSKTGDSLRTAFTKINQNFTELYSAIGADVQIPIQTGNAGKVLTTNGTTLSWTNASGGSADRITSGSHSVVNDGSGALVLNDVQYIYPSADGKDIDIYTHSETSSELWLRDNGPAEIITNGGQYIWTFSKDGTLTFPHGAGFGYGDSGQLKVNDGTTLSLDFRDSSGRGFYTNSDGYTLRSNGSYSWKFGTDAILSLPQNLSVGAAVIQPNASTFGLKLISNGNTFAFGTDGTLTIPNSIRSQPGQYFYAGGDTSTELSWSAATQPPNSPVYAGLGSDASGTTISYSNTDSEGNWVGAGWNFGMDGSMSFPNVPTNQRTGTADALVFKKSGNQKSISTQAGTSGSQTVERLVIAGGDSYYNTDTDRWEGEGGDIYLWAGRGANGGDIKVDAGNALGSHNYDEGGTIKIRGGSSTNGVGGFIDIISGSSDALNGGAINIISGNGQVNGGDIYITAGQGGTQAGRVFVSTPSHQWAFGSDGMLTLPLPAGAVPSIFNTTNVTIGSGTLGETNWIFNADGNLVLPQGSTLGETSSTTVITPPGANAGQSLVIRPTASMWSVTSSGYITYGSSITVTVNQLLVGQYFGTVNYEITGAGVTQQSLGRPLTGSVVITRAEGQSSQPVTWTIPANSNISEFTFTLTTVDGTRSNDIVNETDPALYYSFEENALPAGTFATITNNNISNSEASHIHLVAGNPATTDLYLGDDDQYVKIEKNAGNVVVGTDTNTNHWTFNTDGNIVFPDNTVQTTAYTGILPSPTYSGSNSIGNVTPAPLNLNNTGSAGQVKTQLTLINTAGNAGTGSAVDYFTYTDAGNGVPGARLQAVDDNAYSANFSIALKGVGNAGNNGLTTVWTFGSDGRTTFPAATVPAHSYGVAGDKVGMVAFDDNYIYYCKQNYVNNSTNIWVRVAWSGTSW
jgi:hypothetical protein